MTLLLSVEDDVLLWWDEDEPLVGNLILLLRLFITEHIIYNCDFFEANLYFISTKFHFVKNPDISNHKQRLLNNSISIKTRRLLNIEKLKIRHVFCVVELLSHKNYLKTLYPNFDTIRLIQVCIRMLFH